MENKKSPTLKKFLLSKDACSDRFEFAKDLTLKQFLDTCERGDWILWLFARTNPQDIRYITLATAHCVNTVRHFMADERSTTAIDVAIRFGQGKATKQELHDAHAAAAAAAAYADCANAADYAAHAAAYDAARSKNRLQTADVGRKYLPLQMWNTNQITS